MKKFLTVCTLLAIVAVAAFASTAKESLKGPEATKQVIRKLDQSKVKALPVENYEDERETMKLELEALNATISSLISAGADYSAQKSRAAEVYGLLFPASRASSLDQGGDNCASATVVTGIPYCVTGTTDGFGNDYSSPNCGTGFASPDVVYVYTPTADVVLTASTQGGSTWDTALSIFEGCPDAGGTEIGCNDDFGNLQSCLTVTLLGGHTYYIIVDGCCSSSHLGAYTLHLSNDGVCGSGPCPATCENPGPVADNCQDAVLVAVPSVQYGSTVGTTADILGFCGTSDGSNGGVWYKVIGTGNTMTATTCDPCSDYDTKIRVFTCGCDVHSCVAGNDDSQCNGAFTLLSSVSWATDLGAEYLILVHGFSGTAGRFGLTLSDDGVPSNGDGIVCPCNNEQLAAPGSTSGSTTGAGDDCALRGTEDWVVEVSIPYADEWRFSLCGSSYDTYLFLGTDCCLGDIAANDDYCGLGSEICTFVPEGLIYVTIEGYSGSGDWTLLVEPCVPPVGSCCYSEAGGDICSVPLCADHLTEGECAQLGGVWTRDGNCVDNACPGSAPCVCRCEEHPNSHAIYAIDNTTYPIFDVTVNSFTINVPVQYSITDLNVAIDAIHTFDADVEIRLTSPMGTTIILSDNHGGGDDNWLCTEYDDEATTPVAAGFAPFSGSFIPDQALSSFDGENALGNWTLTFDDQVGGDEGFLLGACLRFEYDRILPVGFGSFDAVSGDAQVTLNWNTESESNVATFEVLRDGAKVGEVAAQNSASGASYSFVDNGLTNGVSYSYALVSVDLNGDRATLATQSATPAGSAVISEYALHQNYPNPFNPTTNIAFDMVEAGQVNISIFNVMGQKIAEIVSGNVSAGRHVVSFDATGLSSGLYLYKMEANGYTAQAKMVLMK